MQINSMYTPHLMQMPACKSKEHSPELRNPIPQGLRPSSVNNFSFPHTIYFTGVRNQYNETTGLPTDSNFYRDHQTLDAAAQILKENFKNGTTILDYACSNGEEALSLNSLLKENRGLFNIIGLDTSKKAIEQANEGVYSIYPNQLDTFLVEGAKNEKEKEMSELFNSFFTSCEVDDFATKNRNEMFGIKSFKVDKSLLSNINYQLGDIRKVDEFEPDKKVGAIFFRNGFYHLINSSDFKKIFKEPEKNYGNDLNECINVEKRQAEADDLVDKMYKRLEVGGIFVVGDSAVDRIFLAGKDTPKEDTVKLSDTDYFPEVVKSFEKKYEKDAEAFSGDLFALIRQQEMEFVRQTGEAMLLKKTPLETALEKDGRFKRVHDSSDPIITEPYHSTTIWQKVA